MDASEVGRYGTLSLLKRLDPSTVVATYPIDDSEVTIGRDPNCSIRLYYPAVSAMHCKIFFDEDRKAFIQVLGTNGAIIDGCPVFPSSGPTPTIVPLPNQSTLDIHKRSFRFAYPPKHLRPLLLATPAASPAQSPTKTRRALRMSMIHSAHVFSPAPSTDPRVNLRVLQSPLKAPFGRAPGTPDHLKSRQGQADDDGEIVLVESDCPRVVEEERDLVILDHVTVPDVPLPFPASPSSPSQSFSRPPQSPVSPSPSPFTASSSTQNQAPAIPYSPVRSLPLRQPAQTPARAPPQTPVRRPRPSLHRAVLLRSAQRVAMRREMQREEEEDAEEVEEVITGVVLEQSDEDEEEVEEGEEGSDEEMEDEDEQQPQQPQVSGWRKSLDVVRGGIGWALRAASLEARSEPQEEAPEHLNPDDEHGQLPVEVHDLTEEEDEGQGDYAHEEEEYEYQDGAEIQDAEMFVPEEYEQEEQFMNEDEDEDEADTVPELGPVSPVRLFTRPLVGGFAPSGAQGLGQGTGPRRVRIVEPWKVADIVVPIKTEGIKTEATENGAGGMGQTSEETNVVRISPAKAGTLKRERVTAEEREAIRERRRSALATPDTFFPGSSVRRAAARFPTDPSTPRLPSLIDAVNAVAGNVQGANWSKNEPGPSRELPKKSEVVTVKDDPEEDTQILLARMRSMVEGAKRRQSVGSAVSVARLSMSPRKRTGRFSLLAPQRPEEADADLEEQNEDEDVEMQDNIPQEGSTREPPVPEEHDVEMHDVPEDPKAHAEPALQTPRMDDLRHVFGGGAALPPKTPRLDGMRQMFAHGWQAATPALEGVGEMLATPTGYRAPVVVVSEEEEQEVQASEHAESQNPEAQGMQDEPEAPLEEDAEEIPEPPPTRSTRARKTPTPTPPAVRRTPRSVAATRQTQVIDLDTVPEDDAVNTASTSGTQPKSSNRMPTRPTIVDVSGDEGEPVPTTSKTVRRTRKATSDLEDTAPEPNKTIPARRTRKATSDIEDAPALATDKPARRTRTGRTPQPQPQPNTVPQLRGCAVHHAAERRQKLK
ncbi:hypothetical protein CERSUDRAFT_73959 [Gelatoporia subvermispora B]|uniref:FHA domain-containing protein n=1 Tax=Ceriporiopsis subvermispora (strain B) TaxID=914234 RepID=M2RDR7_CERS8|nr:hypothetical protein CERSUDRAFT_73959 [Gelatoporia subvermispora B]